MLEFELNNLKEITQEEFDEWVNANANKKRMFLLNNYNLSNLKIKNKDLRAISFHKCLLNNIHFENCDLRCMVIGFSKIIDSNFVNCNFEHSFFVNNEFLNTNLSTCNIKRCNFDNSVFNNTIMPNYPMACPEKGSFIGYKKVCDINDRDKYYILKLEIPDDAKRNSSIDNECRCDKAKVLEIQNLDGSIAENITKAESLYTNFIYELGETVEEPKFDECRWHEFTLGIHFFIDKKEAIDYNFILLN